MYFSKIYAIQRSFEMLFGERLEAFIGWCRDLYRRPVIERRYYQTLGMQQHSTWSQAKHVIS